MAGTEFFLFGNSDFRPHIECTVSIFFSNFCCCFVLVLLVSFISSRLNRLQYENVQANGKSFKKNGTGRKKNCTVLHTILNSKHMWIIHFTVSSTDKTLKLFHYFYNCFDDFKSNCHCCRCLVKLFGCLRLQRYVALDGVYICCYSYAIIFCVRSFCSNFSIIFYFL